MSLSPVRLAATVAVTVLLTLVWNVDTARAADGAEPPLAGVHVAFLVGEGFMDSEMLMPLAYLLNRGAEATTIGLERGEVEAVSRGWTVRVEKRLDEVDIDQFDALVIPGGESPAHLRQYEAAVQFSKDFYLSGKPVAAVCHGPQLLMEADVLEGVTATCVPSIVDDLKAAGADYVDEAVVRDGNLITSRTPQDLQPFSTMIEQVLLEREQD